MAELLFIVLGITAGYYVYDGWMSGGVWVKGGRRGGTGMEMFAHKCYCDRDPVCYWIAMAFYSGAALFAIYGLLFGLE